MPIILKHLPDVKIILYGSRARQDDTQGSDIDIALYRGKKIEDATMSTIINDLEESDLPIYFDVIDFHAVSAKMQQEILKDGTIWEK